MRYHRLQQPIRTVWEPLGALPARARGWWLATIVASQALISGSFTLVNEAIRLNFCPRYRIVYARGGSGMVLLD